MKIAELTTRLSPDLAHDAAIRSLGASARLIATRVQAALSHPPGRLDEYPAERTGALASSIGVAEGDSHAVVGSSDPVAALQELGTQRAAPRPFLAPIAAEAAEEVARSLGVAVHEAIGTGLTATL